MSIFSKSNLLYKKATPSQSTLSNRIFYLLIHLSLVLSRLHFLRYLKNNDHSIFFKYKKIMHSPNGIEITYALNKHKDSVLAKL